MAGLQLILLIYLLIYKAPPISVYIGIGKLSIWTIMAYQISAKSYYGTFLNKMIAARVTEKIKELVVMCD